MTALDHPDSRDDGSAPSAPRQMPWYLGLQASWFLGMGLQMVLFTYLAADRLGLPATLVGVAQASLMVPSTVLILVGGVVADRVDSRILLARLYLLAAIPPLLLGLAVLTDWLTFPLLVTYGLAMGTLTAFTMPARDSLLNPVVERTRGLSIQAAVTRATLAQFVSQVLGMAAASVARFVSVGPVLILHSITVGLGALAALRLDPDIGPATVRPEGERRSVLREIREGLDVVRGSERLTTVILTVSAVGVLAIGSFLVALPVFVAGEFGGGAGRFAAFNLCFWTGTVISAFILSRLKSIAFPGRYLIGALAGASACSALFTQIESFGAFLLLCHLWGLSAGVNITMTRSLVQEAAPTDQRARVLAIYQLGFMGGAPIGAVAMGRVVERVGPADAMLVPAVGLFGIILVLLLFTRFWHLRPAAEEETQTQP